MSDYDLDRAYSVSTPGESRQLYADWAETYDESFGRGWGYVAPREIATLYLAHGGGRPVLDVGAGTGLVAEHLKGAEAHALDISPKMLAQARDKGLYADLYIGDLTRPLTLPAEAYEGVVSCGTFTHGHVGPSCLPELLRVARPGALFVCGTKADVFDGMGFGSALAGL